MSSFVEVQDLSKSYVSGRETLKILDGLNLEVAKGESVAIVGESGSGKSTLLHVLGGMDQPDAGQVRISGQNIFDWTALELAHFRNHNLGFVFQFHHLLPEFNARENVAFPKLIRSFGDQANWGYVDRLLDEVGLGHRGYHRPGKLSGGEQQRIALTRALAGEPKLLLADEPTGNLDPGTANQIEDLLFELHQNRGLTTILVTHSTRLAGRCHRIKRLENGRLH